MKDHIFYQEKRYYIHSSTPYEIFNPNNIGIITYSRNTACWNGYLLFFEIRSDKLLLDCIFLNTKEEPPLINGISPNKEMSLFDYTYAGLEYNIEFSGTMEIFKDLISDINLNKDLQSPNSYDVFYELKFEKGILIEAENKSNKYLKSS